jgi:hypothetical protein
MLKAKPGVQTGPPAGDSGTARKAGSADTVVCKDGSNASRTGEVCLKHGGIDWAATQAVLKARGETTGETPDSGSGAPSDTALKAKPGLQTGPDTGSMRSDSGSTSR